MFLLPFAYRRRWFLKQKRDVITESHHALCYLLQIAKGHNSTCIWREKIFELFVIKVLENSKTDCSIYKYKSPFPDFLKRDIPSLLENGFLQCNQV